MKRFSINNIYNAAATLLGCLMLAGCSGEADMAYNDSEVRLSAVKFNLTMTVGHGPSSLSSNRQLVSSDASQSVSNMRVYLFRANLHADPNDNSAFRYCQVTHEGSDRPLDYYYVPAFEKDYVWKNDSDETHAILIDPYLEKGYQYKLLAIGRDDISENSPDAGLLRQATVDGNDPWIPVSDSPSAATSLADVAMAINLKGVRLQTGELFTGCTEAFVVDDDHEDFTASITLNRSVVGMLMYIENVPTHFKAMADFTRPGIMPPYEPMPLITKGKEYKVASVAIAPITITSKVGLIGRKACGELGVNANFRGYFADTSLANAQDRDGYFINTNPDNEKHPNSILAGNFILPIESSGDLNIIDGYEPFGHTLYLVFYTTDNDMDDHTFATPFFWYPIEMVNQIYDSTKGEYVDAPGAAPQEAYPLRANQIYSLGERYGNVDAPLDLSALAASQSRAAAVAPVLKLKTHR